MCGCGNGTKCGAMSSAGPPSMSSAAAVYAPPVGTVGAAPDAVAPVPSMAPAPRRGAGWSWLLLAFGLGLLLGRK